MAVDTVDTAQELAWESTVDGPVTVQRTIERRADGLVVRYPIESTAETPVEVTITDELPVAEPEEVGFQPDSAPREWSQEGTELSFVHRLDTTDSVEIVMGLLMASPPGEEFSQPDRPTIESVDHLAASADLSTDSGDERAPSGLFERAKERISSSDDETGTVPEQVGVDSTADTCDTAATEHDSEYVVDEQSSDTAGTDPDSVADDPIASFRAALSETDDAELARLRAALGVEQSRTASMQGTYLKSRLADFDAYVSVLEAFIDDYGSLVEFATATENRQASLDEDVEAITDSLAAMTETVEAVDDRLAAVEQRLDAIDDEMRTVEDRLEPIEPLSEALESTYTTNGYEAT